MIHTESGEATARCSSKLEVGAEARRLAHEKLASFQEKLMGCPPGGAPEPAGGMQIKARGDSGETKWVAPPPGGGIRWQGHSWEQGTFGSMVKRVLLRSPILVEGYFRLRANTCKMVTPQGFLSCSYGERRTERPWLCKKHAPWRGAGS